MFSLDLALRRFFRAVRNALPGATTASRLAQKEGNWRQQPPAQRASAYAQFLHTQQQLRQMHVGQKIAPKIVDLMFAGLRGFIKSPIGEILLLLIIAKLLSLW